MAVRYELVIFDLDGTLIDSAPDICTAVGLALAEFGLPAPDLAAVRRMIGEGQRVLIERAVRGAGGDPAVLLDQVLPRFREHYGRHLVERTALYPGALDTLARLSPLVPLAVATNKPGAWAREIAGRLGMAPHLRWVLGEDDVGRRKPDPLILTEICRQAAVPLARALFVGDSPIDQRTAQAAGMDLALCTWGYGGDHAAAPSASPPPRFTLDALPQLVEAIVPGRATIEA